MHALDQPAPVRIALTREADAAGAVCWINVQDRRLTLHPACLEVAVILTDMADGSRREVLLHRQPLGRLRSGRQRVVLPADLGVYTYAGRRLTLRPLLRVRSEGGEVLVQRSLVGGRACLIGGRPRLDTCAESLLSPKDAWCLFASYASAVSSARRRVVLVTLLAVALVLGNALVGIHDQFLAEHSPRQRPLFGAVGDDGAVPRSKPILYRPHSRGQPLSDALLLSFALGWLGWSLVRRDLARYAHLEISLMLPPLRPALKLPAREVVRGRCDVPLRGATLRVVAANVECFEGVRQRKKVALREPIRAVLLHQCELEHVAAGVSLHDLLDGDIDFGPLFAALYPPLRVDARWGIDIAWQVQLIHPQLIDLAVEGPVHTLRFVDFMQTEGVRVVEPKTSSTAVHAREP